MLGPAIVLGLLIQGFALTLVFWRLGREWLKHIGAVFILMAVLYHGANEIILWLIPDVDPYRRLFDVRSVGPFMLWVSVAILLCTVTYLAVLGRRKTPPLLRDLDAEKARAVRFFDWRLMLILAAPLMAIIIAGQTLAPNGGLQGQGVGATVGLSQLYFLLAVVLAGFGIVVRLGSGWLLPMLAVQSVLFAATGGRFGILFGAAMLLYALGRYRVRLRRRQVIVGAGLAAMLLLVVTSARASQGHLATTSGDSQRYQYLVSGLSQIGSLAAWNQVLADLGYRFDGNSYGAMELQALDNGV